MGSGSNLRASVRTTVLFATVLAVALGTVPAVVAQEVATGSVTVTVVEPDGTTTVAGASVTVMQGTTSVATATTGDAGTALLEVPVGTYSVRADPPPANPTLVVHGIRTEVAVAESDEATATVSLREPILKGVVRMPDGSPAGDVYVGAYHPDLRIGPIHGRSDADGRYTIDLPAGRIQYFIYPTEDTVEYLDTSSTIPVPEPEVRDLTFSATTLRGRVTGPAGESAPGSRVEVVDGAGEHVRGRTKDDGTFGFVAPPGTYTLTATPVVFEPHGWRVSEVAVEVPTTGPVLDLTVPLGAPVEGDYTLSRLDPTPPDGRTLRDTGSPVVSGDARVVSVVASFEAPSEGEDSDIVDIGVLHRPDDGTTVLHRTPAGELLDESLESPLVMDRDGSIVAYRSGATNLGIPGPDGSGPQLTVQSLADGWLTAIPPAQPEASHPGLADQPALALSGDGRTVAYLTDWRDPDTWTWTHAVEVATLGPDGSLASHEVVAVGAPTRGPALSEDGSTLAWVSWTETAGWELHVLDLTSGVEDPVRPVDPGGYDWEDEDISVPSLSADGDHVAYVERLRTPADPWTGVGHLHHLDRTTGVDTPLALFGSTPPVDEGVIAAAVSGDGTTILALADDPEGPDTSTAQAWAIDVASGTVTLVSQNRSGLPADRSVTGVALGVDASLFAFVDSAQNLVVGDDATWADKVHLAALERVEDLTAPTWPGEATVEAVDLGTTQARLTWSAATDDVGVVGYRVERGDLVLGSTTAGDRQLFLTGLTPDTTYAVELIALDAAGRESAPLPFEFRTSAGGETPGSASLVAALVGPGQVELHWDPAEDGATYRVRRAADGAEPVDVGELTTTTFIDLGVPASAELVYSVVTVDGGTVAPHTVPATITTPALTTPTTTWTAPRMTRRTLLELGTDLTVTVLGEPHRQGTADVVHGPHDGPAGTTTIDLTETGVGTGVYRGTFPLIDVASVVSVTGRLGDGAGKVAHDPAANLPVTVSGAVTVSFVTPLPLDGATLQVWTASDYSSHTVPLVGTTAVTLPAVPAGDHALRVTLPGGTVGVWETGIVVAPGQTVPVELSVTHPAELLITVAEPDGDPLPGSVVELRAADGYPIARANADRNGQVRRAGLFHGDEVTIVVTPPATGPYETPAPQTTTLEAGTNASTVTVSPVPTAVLTGTARIGDEPVSNTFVTVVQQLLGRTYTRETTTGPDGTYRLEAYAGDVRIEAHGARGGGLVETALVAGDNVQDLALTGPSTYTLEVDLRTRQPGGEWLGPLEVDWRVAVHFGFRLSTGNGSSAGWSSSRATLRAQPGTAIRLCASGHETGLPSDCAETVLGEDSHVVLPLRLEAAAGIAGELLGSDGSPLTGTWEASVHSTDGGGYRGTQRGAGSDVLLGLPAAGAYQVTFMSRSGSASARVTVTEGEIAYLPPLRLGIPGPFSGPGNATAAVRPEVEPGGIAEFRTTYHATTAAAGAVLRLAVPPGATLAANGLLLDGEEIVGSPGDGYVDVPLGDLPRGATGVVRHAVTLPADLAPGTSLLVAAGMRHSGRIAADSLGAARVQTPGVSLEAPATTASLDVPVSGRAPAGALVEVVSGDAVVGATTATSTGRWWATASLPSRGLWAEHPLVARARQGDAITTSRVAWVTYDVSRPQLESVTVRQADGRRITFDPRDGVARFPYVFVPGTPIIVDLAFDRPDAVREASVTIGLRNVPATRTASDLFRATTTLSFGQEGAIYVDYDGDRIPIALDDERLDAPADLDEARERLPAVLQDVTDAQETEEAPTVPGERSRTVTATLPSLGGGGRFSGTLTVTPGQSYTPTTRDLALAERAGVDVYGVTNSATIGATSLTGTMTAFIPEHAMPADPAELDEMVLTALAAGAAAPAEEDRFRVTSAATTAAAAGYRIGFKYAFDGVTNGDSLKSAWEAGDKYDKIAQLQEGIQDLAGCAGTPMAGLTDRLDVAMNKALANDALSAAWTITGAVAGAGTFGIGTIVVWGIGYGSDKILSADLDDELQEIRSDLAAASEECEDDDEDDDRDDDRDPDRRRRDPNADPTWIYDPSGYVFEGVASNRLEGVTATVLYAPEADGPWAIWDAEWFGQENPLVTDPRGRYGWDVPTGFWQVRYEREGYLTGYSEVLQVLPPHFDVNVGLVSLAVPGVESVSAVAGKGIDVTFDRYMRAGWVDPTTFAVAAGELALDGTVQPLDGETAPDGELLARSFRFVPATSIAAGDVLSVTLAGDLQSYAEVGLGEDVVREVTVAAAPPGDPGGGGGGGGGGTPLPGEPVTAGGTVRSGTGPATPDDRVVTSVTSPVAGMVGIEERDVAGDGPDGFRMLGVTVDITAPAATPEDPLVLEFRLDRSVLPAGHGASGVEVLRNGILVPDCASGTGTARPDPCVASRATDGDDVVVVVRTSEASQWTFAVAQRACPDGRALPPRFTDVPAGSTHDGATRCAAAWRVVEGTGDGRFEPSLGLTRGQAAALVFRLVTAAGLELPPAGDRFLDVEGPHREAVERLAAARIVAGVTAERFAPGRPVTRAQLAALVVRSLERVEGAPLPTGGDAFTDDDGSVHEDAIDAAAAAGLVRGVTADRFAPGDGLTRAQAASMVVRSLDRQVANGRLVPSRG